MHLRDNIYKPECLGVVVNKAGKDWFAIRRIADQLWLLDASEDLPKPWSQGRYHQTLHTYPLAYLVHSSGGASGQSVPKRPEAKVVAENRFLADATTVGSPEWFVQHHYFGKGEDCSNPEGLIAYYFGKVAN